MDGDGAHAALVAAFPDQSAARLSDVSQQIKALTDERKRAKERQKQEDRKRARLLDRLRGVSSEDMLGVLASRVTGSAAKGKAKAKVRAAGKGKAKAKPTQAPPIVVPEADGADDADAVEDSGGAFQELQELDLPVPEAGVDIYGMEDDIGDDVGADVFEESGPTPGVYAAEDEGDERRVPGVYAAEDEGDERSSIFS